MGRFFNPMSTRGKKDIIATMSTERESRKRDPLPTTKEDIKTVVLPNTTITKDSDPSLYDEQMVAKIEIAMLKGYRDIKMVANLLGITNHQADKYMKRVYARWEVVGTANDLKRVRGEGLSRMAMMERKYWQIVETSSDPRAKIVALQSLMEINRQRDLYNGVTQKTMETINQRTEGHEIQARLAKQSKLATMAKQLAHIIREEQDPEKRSADFGKPEDDEFSDEEEENDNSQTNGE